MTNEAETAAAPKRVMIALVVFFIVLVAIWAVSSIDSLVTPDDEATARMLRL